MDQPLLQVEDVTGGYAAAKPVIHHIAFQVKAHEIVGLIGMNGAGKSTTIKHILGLMQPISGTVKLNGRTLDEDPKAFRSRMAYIPETPTFYEELNLWEHLEWTAMAYNLDADTFQSRAQSLLDSFNMRNMTKWFPTTFSKGMQQKLMIMCAFLVRPALLIVDEPFVGLDPVATRSLLHMLTELKNEGAGILMSTHILDTAEKYADHFVMLSQGSIALHGTLAQMRDQADTPGGGTLEDLFMSVTEDARL